MSEKIPLVERFPDYPIVVAECDEEVYLTRIPEQAATLVGLQFMTQALRMKDGNLHSFYITAFTSTDVAARTVTVLGNGKLLTIQFPPAPVAAPVVAPVVKLAKPEPITQSIGPAPVPVPALPNK